MLRLEDGTTCEFPSIRVPFECESWHSACAEMKSNHGPSKEIDVIIQAKNSYLYKKFLDELKVRIYLLIECIFHSFSHFFVVRKTDCQILNVFILWDLFFDFRYLGSITIY